MKHGGRFTLVLGLTGAGVAAMVRNGTIDPCVNQHSPCNQCLELQKGCELPKAMDHRRMVADAEPS